MKKIIGLLLIFILIYCNQSIAQRKDFTLIDDYVKSIGSLDNINVATIADTITRHFNDKNDKARAIFYWITNNIALDAKAIKGNDNRKTDPVDVIEMRKTTPLGFSLLVQEMCSMANIRCLSVDGFVKTNAEEINNKADEINHSWNVIQLGQSPDQWFYIDAANGSGFIDIKTKSFSKVFTSEYFFADRSLFNLDHYPDNPAWQLGSGPANIKDFYLLPVIRNAAYKFGLSNPKPRNGYIKTKSKNPVTFSFSYNSSVPVKNIVLVIGDEKRQMKPEPMNFTDSNGMITFTFQFKKADIYPVHIIADGNQLLEYYVESEE